MTLDLRKFDKTGDINAWRNLFDNCFPENIGTSVSTLEHYKWKLETPFNSKTPAQFVCTEEGKLLGYYSALPFLYNIDGKECVAGMVCDVMTHSDARGKGVFTKMGKYSTSAMADRGFDFTTGFIIRPEVMPGHLKVGWKVMQKMPIFLRPLRSASLLPSRIKFLSFIVDPVLLLFNKLFSISLSNVQVETLGGKEFFAIPGLDSFFLKWKHQIPNSLNKTREFLKWRTSAPTSEYKFVVLKKSEEIVGLAVARPTTIKGVSSLAVIDFMVLEEHRVASKKIHSALFALASQEKRDAVVILATWGWARKYKFFSNFYLPTPAVFSFILKRLNSNIPEQALFNPDRWHLSWIDSDDL